MTRSKLNERPVLYWVSIVTSAMLLAGCLAATSRVTCPPLVTYPPAFQQQAAAELRALPAGSALATMIVDYGKLRDACRAIGR